MATERAPAMNEPILIRGISYRKVGKKIVPIEYAYMAARSTIFDADLILFAEKRALAISEKRKHADQK